ncbi:radical SAM protein [Novipirellula sp. SH528]|uniref:radical SAM protein n=1 Tax=Novipirellula sp. SH528 TaxID=3454466 RepID=UPI003F9F99D5
MPSPVTLSANVHLTHNCNLRCTYCFTGEKFGAGMSQATADQTVDFCIAESVRSAADHLQLIFFGGEPLMKVDLLCWMLDAARQRAPDLRITSKLSTNGILLSESTVSRLAERGVYVSLSLDGDPSLQASQRPDVNGRDVSTKLDASIRRLLAWNPAASVNCVVTPGSAAILDQSVKWIFDRGFSYIQVALDYSGDWKQTHLRDLRAAYLRLADWYYDQTTAGSKFYLSCFDQRIQSWARGPLESRERCLVGFRQFSISSSGRLFPCVQFVREDDNDEFVIGDVHRGFDESKRAQIANCSEQKKPECAGCQLTSRCSSWCACINWQSTGKLNQASPLVCEHERIVMPIADAVANRLWKRRDSLFLHKQYNPSFPVLSFAEDIIIRQAGEDST